CTPIYDGYWYFDVW
nr:immunoglobulin heavy chain junction region [Mus musculus]